MLFGFCGEVRRVPWGGAGVKTARKRATHPSLGCLRGLWIGFLTVVMVGSAGAQMAPRLSIDELSTDEIWTIRWP